MKKTKTALGALLSAIVLMTQSGSLEASRLEDDGMSLYERQRLQRHLDELTDEVGVPQYWSSTLPTEHDILYPSVPSGLLRVLTEATGNPSSGLIALTNLLKGRLVEAHSPEWYEHDPSQPHSLFSFKDVNLADVITLGNARNLLTPTDHHLADASWRPARLMFVILKNAQSRIQHPDSEQNDIDLCRSVRPLGITDKSSLNHLSGFCEYLKTNCKTALRNLTWSTFPEVDPS